MSRPGLLTFLFLVMATQGCVCLRMLSLDVPSAVMAGEGVWLNCTLDLESDDLYSVKWYKDDVEFYRYLPRDNPAGQKYDLPGVHLDLDRSVQGNVFLIKTDLSTEGLYRCEASAESPTFQTVEGEKMINVYVLPDKDPSIIGSQARYEVGEYVNVTCRSRPSKPAAALKWHINGKEADSFLERRFGTEDHHNGLLTSSLGLLFMVKSSDLNNGAITLRCMSTVSQTYSTTSEELVVGDRYPELSSPSNPFTVIARDGPVITGGQTHYRVGDLLHVNCSSPKSNPMPQLLWYLNDKEVGKEYLLHYRGLEGVLGLRLRVQPQHLDENEEMRLKCTATLSKVINTRSEETTLGGGNHRTSGLTVAENFGKVSERSSSESDGRPSTEINWALTCLFLLVSLL